MRNSFYRKVVVLNLMYQHMEVMYVANVWDSTVRVFKPTFWRFHFISTLLFPSLWLSTKQNWSHCYHWRTNNSQCIFEWRLGVLLLYWWWNIGR